MGFIIKTFPQKLEKTYGHMMAQEFIRIGFTTIEYVSVLEKNGALDDKITMWITCAQIYARKRLPEELALLFFSYLSNPRARADVKKYCKKNPQEYISMEMIEMYEVAFGK